MAEIPHLRFRIDGDVIHLEQHDGHGCGEVDYVLMHRVHLVEIARRMGLMQTPAPSVAALQRRLRVLHGRIDHLAGYLAMHSDHEHADLSYETDYARATAAIADEFVADDEPAPTTCDPQPVRIESGQMPDSARTPAQAQLDLISGDAGAPNPAELTASVHGCAK